MASVAPLLSPSSVCRRRSFVAVFCLSPPPFVAVFRLSPSLVVIPEGICVCLPDHQIRSALIGRGFSPATKRIGTTPASAAGTWSPTRADHPWTLPPAGTALIIPLFVISEGSLRLFSGSPRSSLLSIGRGFSPATKRMGTTRLQPPRLGLRHVQTVARTTGASICAHTAKGHRPEHVSLVRRSRFKPASDRGLKACIEDVHTEGSETMPSSPRPAAQAPPPPSPWACSKPKGAASANALHRLSSHLPARPADA